MNAAVMQTKAAYEWGAAEDARRCAAMLDARGLGISADQLRANADRHEEAALRYERWAADARD